MDEIHIIIYGGHMFINYLRGGRPASNLFDTITKRDYDIVGNSLSYMDLCWGECDIICKYKTRSGKTVTEFVTAKNKRIGFPLYGEYVVYEKLGPRREYCIACGDDELVKLNSNRYEMMMPSLRRLPQDIEEYLNLLSIDPRYVLHIQTELLVEEYENNNNLLNDINKIIELSVSRIISNNHDEETDLKEELKMRDAYKKDVQNLMKIMEKDLRRALRMSNIHPIEKTLKIH